MLRQEILSHQKSRFRDQIHRVLLSVKKITGKLQIGVLLRRKQTSVFDSGGYFMFKTDKVALNNFAE